MIRKFEQEAIVNQIMEGVHERVDKQITKAEMPTMRVIK